jgi:hypothetical protein
MAQQTSLPIFPSSLSSPHLLFLRRALDPPQGSLHAAAGEPPEASAASPGTGHLSGAPPPLPRPSPGAPRWLCKGSEGGSTGFPDAGFAGVATFPRRGSPARPPSPDAACRRDGLPSARRPSPTRLTGTAAFSWRGRLPPTRLTGAGVFPMRGCLPPVRARRNPAFCSLLR